MKRPTFLLAMSFLFLLTSCGDSEDAKDQNNADKQKDETALTSNDLETACIFSASEIERQLDYAKTKEEFFNSKFLLVAKEIDQKIGQEYKPMQAKKILTSYLQSENWGKDFEGLCLTPEFVTKRLSYLENSRSPIELLAVINESIRRMADPCLDEATYEKSSASRLPYLNGDTITLKRNTRYRFPTMLFMNNHLLNAEHKLRESEVTWINTSDIKGDLDSISLSIPTNNGIAEITYQSTIFVQLED